MSESDEVTSILTLKELTERLDRIEEEGRIREAQLLAENARLSQRLARLESAGAQTAEPLLVDVESEVADGGRPVSRRGAFKILGAAAAGGVGIALGSTLLGAEPALAATGTMKYGESNNAGSDQTALSGTVRRVALLNLENTETSAPGAGLYAMTYAPSGLEHVIGAIVADTNGKAGPAVVGMSSGGNAIYGIQSAKSEIGGAPHPSAVIGDTDGSGAGVLGLSSAGDGVYGVFNGTSGISTGLHAGVVGDTDESAAGVLGLSSAGDGIYGVAFGKSGISTALHAGVVGDNGTLGPGVIGLSNVCGVYGIATARSSLAAIFAGVTGDSSSETGVLGMSSGADGVHGLTTAAGASGVAGIDQATGSTSHGLYGGSDNGIGGYFQGGRAPLLLAPSSSAGAPTSGDHSKGEIYVDSDGAVFVCTVGDGSDVGTWQQLAFLGN
ncbi:MAG TPA: hypothetical protein VEH29_18385 [Acidimicrobiales bacterium]|nr:hypothetical protein [Acidimicrobiales bacterium]